MQKLVNLADLVKNFQTSIRGHEEDLGLHQVAQAQRGEDHQARQCAEGGLPRGESGHAQSLVERFDIEFYFDCSAK